MKSTHVFMRWLALGLMAALILMPAASTAAQPSAPGARIITAGDAAISKIHPRLRADLGLEPGGVQAQASSVEVEVLAYVKAGTDIGRYFNWSITRPFVNPLGLQAVIGALPAGAVTKIAALPQVAAVQPLRNLIEPPRPADSDPELTRAAVLARQQAMRAQSGQGWWDVGPGHNSRAAWDLGYTGAGVKALVNDSGVDFAHPDLMGAWAVVEDTHSPYYGWPMMFDSWSMMQYVLDLYLGATFTAGGFSFYADTSAVCTADPCAYQPLGAGSARSYALTGTSLSGRYHIGSHPDRSLADYVFGNWNGRYEGEEHVALLVVDENQAGVYDTVYVDLNGTYDFSDDKPVNRESPVAYLDYWDSAANAPGQDGYADASGGLVYFIADGINPIPACDWLWGGFCPPPANGSLVALMFNDYVGSPAGDHGQLVASNMAGQGVIDGLAPPHKTPGDGTPFTGLVQAAGRDLKLTANGDFYRSSFIEDGPLFAALGYDGVDGSGDDSQIINNSWGDSGADNDGWDFISRLFDAIVRHLNPSLSSLHSTGNGAPGYGTAAPPSPPAGIAVGASSQYDTSGVFEPIFAADQINWGDVTPFSNRGPGARGNNGIDVTANGAWGTGATPLNLFGDGWTSWDLWGGTSRSAPVAAGNLALVYDAYRQRTGRWPTWDVARAILMSGADDQRYDGFVQGAGAVNGGASAAIAGGDGGFYVTPADWTTGDYRGVQYAGFANILHAGDVVTQTFTVANPSAEDATLSVSSRRLVKIAEYSFPFTSKDVALESGAFTRPDYIFWITNLIPADADLLEVQVAYPFQQFDPDGDYSHNQAWRVHVQNWKDVNGNGRLWQDLNGDGVVNAGEIDVGEHSRFDYANNAGNSLAVRVKDPLQRMHDGVFISLRHNLRSQQIRHTNLKIHLSFYKQMDFPWLTLPAGSLIAPAGGMATFDAVMSIPADTAVGLYNGAIHVADGAQSALIPVVANVAASGADFSFGGGRRSDTPYDNGRVFGYTDWTWRAESGDWRFFFTDLPDDLPPGTMFLVDNRWESPSTDIDTRVMGPVADAFSNDPDDFWYDPDYFGPYALNILPGSSENRYLGSGRWQRHTSSGGPREIVAVPAQPGLHLIALHNVLFGGEYVDEGFQGRVGTLRVDPATLELETESNSVLAEITLTASLPLDDLVAEGFGLSAPQLLEDQVVGQDDPFDPSTASYTRTATIDHAARLTVTVEGKTDDDIDLFLYDPNGRLAAQSTTPTADEFVSVQFPADGEWTVAVHGWSVGSVAVFDLHIDAVQGYDVQVVEVPSGPFAAGAEITIGVAIEREMVNGETLYGAIVMGPSVAPGLVEAPVMVHAVQPAARSVVLPLLADTWVNGGVGEQNTNNNTFAALIARTTGLDNILLSFDRSALPAGAQILAAELTVQMRGQSGAFGKSLAALNTGAFDSVAVTYNSAPAIFNPGDPVAVPDVPGPMSFDVTAQVAAWDALGQLALSASGPPGRVILDSLENFQAHPPRLQVWFIPPRGAAQ